MRKRTWLVAGGIAASVVVALALIPFLGMTRDAAEFRAQMKLAKAEGIPTTWQEFAATIPHAAPSENAAPLYRALARTRPKRGDKDYSAEIDRDLIFHPGEATRRRAAGLVASYRESLRLAEQAVQRPKCWFDRDWSRGGGTVMPELFDMRAVAQALAVRGSLAAERGDSAAAIADVRKVFRIARHAGSEPQQMSRLVQDSIYLYGVRDLANWSFTHRSTAAYRDALREAVDGLPAPNLKEEHRGDLFMLLSIIDLAATPEGRRELGFPGGGSTPADRFMPYVMIGRGSKARVVKALRDSWAALSHPKKEREERLARADQDLSRALTAIPAAARFGDFLGTSGPDRESSWQARKLQYMAFLAALKDPKKTPRTLDTSKLRSPFDGNPLDYKYDGVQMSIKVSGFLGGSRAGTLKFPPDEPYTSKSGLIRPKKKPAPPAPLFNN